VTEYSRVQAITDSLTDSSGLFRYTPRAEERRVEELLDVRYMNPDDAQGRLVKSTRALLTRAGLRRPTEMVALERPDLNERQEEMRRSIGDELEAGRQRLRECISDDIDRVAIDANLGLRSETQLLPETLRNFHAQAEQSAGREIRFVEWLTDFASDEQLLNVWQWHDGYLDKLDAAPQFEARVERLKREYQHGLQRAIAEGELHSDLMKKIHHMDDMKVVHGSPLSPIMAIARAQMVRARNTVYVRDGVTDDTLFHEFTHGISGGLVAELDEGATDIIAASVFNHSSHREKGGSYCYQEAYTNDVRSMQIIEALSEGMCGTLELSRACAGSDPIRNTVDYTLKLDEQLGLPLSNPLILFARSVYARANDHGVFAHNEVVEYSSLRMRKVLEVLRDVLLDAQGRHVAYTAQELVSNILSPRRVDKYDVGDITDALYVALKIGEQQQLLESMRS
jgi:hypothetical protein